MYSINGDFGKVRLCRQAIARSDFPVPYKLTTGGWHKCNDKYMIHREHGLDVFVFLFNISSGGIAQIENRKWIMKPNSIILLPPHVYHEYYTDTGQEWEHYWMCATGPNLNELLTQVVNKSGYYYENIDLKSIISKYETIFPERFLDIPEVYDIKASHIVSEILHEFLLKIQNQVHKQNHSEIVSILLKELETNYSTDLNINRIAEENGISTQYLIKLFKNETGHTPYEYLKKYRLAKAGELLTFSQKSIHEIAAETGFSSTSNFILQFRKEKGMTPGNYRSSLIKERKTEEEKSSNTVSSNNYFEISPAIEKALAYIQTNYREPVSQENVAKYCGISISYLSKSFKKGTGQTFSQYINRYRLQKAAELLANSQSNVLDIALQSGFSNFSYFIREFKKEFGVTPGRYRQLPK